MKKLFFILIIAIFTGFHAFTASNVSLSFNEINAFNDVVAIDVDDSAAVSHTITSGKTFVYFMNVGSSPCWYGGATIDPDNSRGVIVLPYSGFVIENAKSSFKIYFKCETGLSTTIGIIEG